MSEKHTHTVVIEYPADGSPAYFAGMEALGGRVVAVAFDGNRLEVADELLEALQDVMDTGYTGGPQGKRARAAIAKATGVQS